MTFYLLFTSIFNDATIIRLCLRCIFQLPKKADDTQADMQTSTGRTASNHFWVTDRPTTRRFTEMKFEELLLVIVTVTFLFEFSHMTSCDFWDLMQLGATWCNFVQLGATSCNFSYHHHHAYRSPPSICGITNHHLADEAASAAFAIIVTAIVMVVIVGCRQYWVNENNNNTSARAATAAAL